MAQKTYEIPGFSFTLAAGEDLSASEGCAVDINSSGLAITPAADGGRVAGILRNHPALGQGATIVVDGVARCKVGTGGITAGQTVQALTDGRITAGVAGDYAVGIALETGAANTFVPVLLTPGGGGGLIA
jgi:hypothetical protein